MPLDAVWLPFLVKLLAAVIVVVAASLAAERVGPYVAALIAALPVSAGPAYVMLALQNGDPFIAASALHSFATNIATCLFALTLVHLGPRVGLIANLLAAFAAWLAAVAVVQALEWNALAAALANVAAFALCLPLTRQADYGARPKALPRRWYDLPMRALLVGLLVAAVATAGRSIGPAATGIAAVFPISLTTLVLVVRPRLGGAALALAMASVLRAMIGFAAAALLLHLTAVPLGRWPALALALAVSLGWSATLLIRQHRLARLRAAV